MGLISRVSSRTYRASLVKNEKMLTNTSRRALSHSMARRGGTFFGGDGQNWLNKSMTKVLHHNPNGNIRYKVYKAQFTGMKLSGNTLLTCTGLFAISSLYINVISNPKLVVTNFHYFPGDQYKMLRDNGI